MRSLFIWTYKNVVTLRRLSPSAINNWQSSVCCWRHWATVPSTADGWLSPVDHTQHPALSRPTARWAIGRDAQRHVGLSALAETCSSLRSLYLTSCIA